MNRASLVVVEDNENSISLSRLYRSEIELSGSELSYKYGLPNI